MSHSEPRSGNHPAAAAGAALTAIEMAGATLSGEERTILERLGWLVDRVRAHRFQLAVVGQFKRGKSTLLNALLGFDVLPTGVVPLTAIPTFLVHAERPWLDVAFADGAHRRFDLISVAALRERLGEFVTETGNPHNAQGVARVEAGVPAELLAAGVVLIDTPGIGSAERHNSEAALATLPECDAALIVLSPDPPITEAEIAYLGEIRGFAAAILPVLNKIDLVRGAERDAITDYVARVLRRIGIGEALSLVAAGGGNRIGIGELQDRVRSLAGEGQRILEDAAALKLKAGFAELAFQNQVALAALKLPIEALDKKVSAITETTGRILAEHGVAADLMAGERQRLLDRIDEEAKAIRGRVQPQLFAMLPSALKEKDELDAFRAIATASSGLFDAEYRSLASSMAERLSEIAARADDRIAPVLERMRRSVAEALGIDFVVPTVTAEAKGLRELAWTERQVDTMNPLPTGFIDHLLPVPWRLALRRRRLEREIERIATLNTENVRWTLRQQAEDILRSLGRDLDKQLRDAAGSTMALAEHARDIRRGAAGAAASEIAAREAMGRRLAEERG